MSLTNNGQPKQSQLTKGIPSMSKLTILTPNQGSKSFTIPVPTKTNPGVITIADSISPMTLNDMNQILGDTSEFVHTRTATDAEKDYTKKDPEDRAEDNSQQTSEGIFSTPLEPYP